MNDARSSDITTSYRSKFMSRTGSDTKQILGFGQRGPRGFFASPRTSIPSGIRGHSPFLRWPPSSHNASPSPPHAVPLTRSPSLMGNRQALVPAPEERTSGLVAMRSQTCSYVLRVVAPGRMPARVHCVRHQTRRTFPGQNLVVAMASSVQQGPRVGC